MSDAINGQIVPALGQWQGAALIQAAIAVAYLVRRLRKRGHSLR